MLGKHVWQNLADKVLAAVHLSLDLLVKMIYLVEVYHLIFVKISVYALHAVYM